MLEGLAERMGRGIEVQVDSSVLRRSHCQHTVARIHSELSHQTHVHASCAHSAESYTCVFQSGEEHVGVWQTVPFLVHAPEIVTPCVKRNTTVSTRESSDRKGMRPDLRVPTENTASRPSRDGTRLLPCPPH
jgi:hypothetical protein